MPVHLLSERDETIGVRVEQGEELRWSAVQFSCVAFPSESPFSYDIRLRRREDGNYRSHQVGRQHEQLPVWLSHGREVLKNLPRRASTLEHTEIKITRNRTETQ
jgi:hypothetical protein